MGDTVELKDPLRLRDRELVAVEDHVPEAVTLADAVALEDSNMESEMEREQVTDHVAVGVRVELSEGDALSDSVCDDTECVPVQDDVEDRVQVGRKVSEQVRDGVGLCDVVAVGRRVGVAVMVEGDGLTVSVLDSECENDFVELELTLAVHDETVALCVIVLEADRLAEVSLLSDTDVESVGE